MPRNVEIKARVNDFDEFKLLAEKISGEKATVIEQSDTFFVVPTGRLKLRELKGSRAELIFYNRSDEGGPKLSDYCITEVFDPQQLKETLSCALGVRGCVVKTRWLYMVGQTRVHADLVKGLGTFMELEVVLREDQTTEDGSRIAEDLMSKLKVPQSHLLKGAYMDMLLKQ